MSHKHLLHLEEHLRGEVHELLRLGESADQGEVVLPGGLVIEDEFTRWQLRLENLAKAKARAQERYATAQAEYDTKVREREEKAIRKGHRPGGKPPQPPRQGPVQLHRPGLTAHEVEYR